MRVWLVNSSAGRMRYNSRHPFTFVEDRHPVLRAQALKL